MTVKEAVKFAADFLADITDEAENEAKILVSYLADTSIGNLTFSDKVIDEAELINALNRRKEKEPLQYIIGKWWFYKGEFFVGEGVLIPRQDTETLVETAAELLKGQKKASVCDLCAGSGCVGISIGQDFPDAEVACVERYEKAFLYLERNIRHNKVENVKAVSADVLEEPFGKYDLIVSNPPYITAEDMKKLSPEVKREPESALFGGEDGLFFYRAIAKNWKNALKSQGRLVFEVGIGEAEDVFEILEQNGFSNITVVNDLCGVQRVVFGTVNDL